MPPGLGQPQGDVLDMCRDPEGFLHDDDATLGVVVGEASKAGIGPSLVLIVICALAVMA